MLIRPLKIIEFPIYLRMQVCDDIAQAWKIVLKEK
jgi:hypothetical protein